MKSIDIIVKKNEEKILPFVWINGKNASVDYRVELLGEGANCHILGVLLGSQISELVFSITIIHKAPKTKSRVTLRGVFNDQSSFSNDGLVRIEKGAKGADGFYSSKILLFDNAQGRSIPSLEIDENDLKAGHASTVGRPDESQLFYLKSRGLSKKQAEQLIITGFFDSVIRLLPKKYHQTITEKINSCIKYSTM